MGGNSSEKRRHSNKRQMGIYLWPLKEMETGCSFTSPPPSLLSNASVFPHLFFPFTVCSSPRLKFWHSSLSLNRDDDKNLKPIPIRKGTLCQIPLPSLDILGGEVHGCVDADSSLLLFHSTTRNGLRSMGAQDCSLQLTQRQCLLCHFAFSTISLWQGQVPWAAVGLQWPTHQTDWLCNVSYCIPALWPSAQVVCPAHLKV